MTRNSISMILLAIVSALWVSFLVPKKSITPELQPWYNEYVSILKEECPDWYREPIQMTLKMEELPYPEIGLCSRYLTGFVLRIDNIFWKTYPEADRKATEFHELTHCILGLKHNEMPGDYMEAKLSPITEWLLDLQVRRDMKNKCGKYK